MKSLLVINSSAAREGSVSRTLVEETVARLLEANPFAEVVRRDLGATPVPHLSIETLEGVRGVPATPAEQDARRLSDQLIAELRGADTIVIGAPMYNFGVTTSLRAWFDHVLRAGETFSYSEAGPKGLLGGKRVIVIESRGGLYSEGPASAYDFQEPYLKHLFGFVGITDVTFVHAEKIGYGPEARAAALTQAKSRIATLAGSVPAGPALASAA
jgi:FMN-dependent NADH-azoreductase